MYTRKTLFIRNHCRGHRRYVRRRRDVRRFVVRRVIVLRRRRVAASLCVCVCVCCIVVVRSLRCVAFIASCCCAVVVLQRRKVYSTFHLHCCVVNELASELLLLTGLLGGLLGCSVARWVGGSVGRWDLHQSVSLSLGSSAGCC